MSAKRRKTTVKRTRRGFSITFSERDGKALGRAIAAHSDGDGPSPLQRICDVLDGKKPADSEDAASRTVQKVEVRR